MDELIWLRNWIIFSFFLDIPPMHPQNVVLQIMDAFEVPSSQRINGILVLEDLIQVQLVFFKNSQYIRE